jgi:hypothetical protein
MDPHLGVRYHRRLSGERSEKKGCDKYVEMETHTCCFEVRNRHSVIEVLVCSDTYRIKGGVASMRIRIILSGESLTLEEQVTTSPILFNLNIADSYWVLLIVWIS